VTHIVVRLYTDSGPLVGKIRESEAEVRAIMAEVPGFQRYGFADTGSGAVSITVCEDKAGCDESVRRAAEWIKANLPDADIAPPQIFEGESAVHIQHRVAPEQPHIVVRLFNVGVFNPAVTLLREGEAEIRELTTGLPGFRSYSVIDTGTGGVSILVGDDKASTDEVARHVGPWIEARLPDLPPVQRIEAEGVFRFTAEDVAAPA
jgi:hypothetical protein